MSVAYFDCFSGISGDMTLGALVHLGVPVDWLASNLRRLPLDGFELVAERVKVNGIEATKVRVTTAETHHHRDVNAIAGLINRSPLSNGVKAHALRVFDTLAEAEAKIHGCDKASIHFHEVGAVDAIVDIVGSCLALERLGVTQVVSSALPLGRGMVRCAHGVLPVPAPAVLELLQGVPVYGGDAEKEMVTPTGASILMGSNACFGALPEVRIRKVGYGAGTHQLKGRPNLLRIVLGEPVTARDDEAGPRLIMVETCIDDMNPELFGYLMETLFADGALDVYWTPVQMKKNRPGTLVSVLCPPARRSVVVDRLLAETTTLGVRHYEVRRTALVRETVQAASAFGQVEMKRIRGADGSDRLVPEYEICRQIAKREGLALRQVYETLLKTAQPLAEQSDRAG
ncbi:MAG: nickel pincer cofactor biosynthesis protein LarC [Desulfatitalea sp.]|nr:nickel pincer cofactor biosynthesis protein LarC [Desulfatitalea sp.]